MFSALLTLTLLCALASFASANTAQPWSFPLVEEPITIKAMGLQSPQGGDHNTMAAWQEYEKMTNIHIEWENVPTATYEERFSVVMASNDLPDMFWAMGISTANLVRYGAMGVFAQLDPYIASSAYNFQNIIDENPSVRGAITMADGHIYGLPNMNIGDNMRTNKLFVNPDWLKAVGKEVPESIDEFTDVLRAFRDNDANENGDPNDEIPFIVRYNDGHFLPILYTFFGLGNRGVGHRYVDWDYENETLRFIPTSTQFKDLLTWANMLYSEKLLDPQTFENKTSREIVAKTSANLVGAHGDYVTNTGSVMQEIFRCIPVMTNYYGEKAYTRTSAMVTNQGSFVINAKTPYVEELVKWADYWYGADGQLMSNMGIEGLTYVKNEDGTVRFTDLMINNPEGLTLTQVRVNYMGYQGGAVIYSDQYYQGAETYWTATELMEQYRPYLNEEIWESFNPTFEENEAMAEVWTDIKSYIDEMVALFITGGRPLSDWDNYVAEFDRMGVDQYMTIYNAMYERYASQK
ncbi:MAG: extracellular solute-binding protein [Oscillospiraceae bacterium]|jgi:putative aldouronate transport system substrate-binding protein|nr:extracellular solute-binding protein [Oscillospiraceae bacterium]